MKFMLYCRHNNIKTYGVDVIENLLGDADVGDTEVFNYNIGVVPLGYRDVGWLLI